MRIHVSLIMALGCALVAFASLLGLAVIMNRRVAAMGGRDLSPLIPLAVATTAIGFGLILHRKWAAVLFLLMAGGFGLFLILGSLIYIHNAGALISIACGGLLVLLARIVIARWSILK